MLWVSEGVTVYYEDLILNRAGLLTRDEVLEQLRSNIARYENIPGHLFQSATAVELRHVDPCSSAGSENAANTTISYYDKGAALGMLLDLKIRHESKNRKSLDDVMRTLYRTYYKEKKRGFTDEEFRQVCETAAGCRSPSSSTCTPPPSRTSTTGSYLAYAGLAIDVSRAAASGAFLGAVTAGPGRQPRRRRASSGIRRPPAPA